ncbi:MAG: metalloregulator ArsR/SmtB family transcription factor [Rhodococcus sp. (in: high G+C Gram-positive bacteria)]
MAQYPNRLDTVFATLSDPTRRAVIDRLSTGPASVSELAGPFDMALPSFMKHVRMLEQSGWISTRKTGRVRICALDTTPFSVVDDWLQRHRAMWEQHTDRLENFVTEQENQS